MVYDTIRGQGLGRVFTRAQATAAGLTLKQLRAPGITRVMRGVYTKEPDPDRLEIRAAAALLLAGPGALLCGSTVLRLLGVAVPEALLRDPCVHVLVPRERTGPRIAGIRVRRSDGSVPTVRVRGLSAVHPIECWLQLAEDASVNDLVIVADGLMRRSRPVAGREEIAAALSSAGRRRGLVSARRAFAKSRERTDSAMESVLRLLLVDAGLPCPVVNFPIEDDYGRVVYYLDLAYPEVKVGVEYNGAGHVGDRRQMERDETRRRFLEDRGWRIITVTAADLRDDPAGVVRSVGAALTGATIPDRSSRSHAAA